ncbi:MAG: hypothetical protein A3K10_16555 [Bacteroidetes bacterium RIFCSPLOWO2_12_FULL_31_6]|nr:MAG: hypothetical protein A3K10_16555 [Bacteroidetes bacterium RIFCSPLOWO2_12_FULL_31_6]
MKNTIVLLLLTFFFFSCSKEDNSVPSAPSGTGQTPTPTVHTTFIYLGTMNVEKYDSSGNAISTYPLININSKIVGTRPNYVLSTNFDASNLKGETNSSISVNIPTDYFNAFTSGTGIFTGGVLNGYNTRDSLYYRVFYIDVANNNNIFLDYSGKLTSSY